MPLPLLDRVPSQKGYSWSSPGDTDLVELEGGLSRRRRDVENSNREVRVNWTVDQVGYQYLSDFYHVTIKEAGAFEIDLIMDDGDLTRHTAHIVPGTFGLNGVDGATYMVGAVLDVEPLPADADADNDFMDLFEGYGGDTDVILGMLGALEKLVNFDIPAIDPDE